MVNKKIETETNADDGEYEESGSDLSDCETESVVSTLVSQTSTLSLDAASDAAIDQMGECIPLLRAPPFPILSTTIRFVYPDTSTYLMQMERINLSGRNRSFYCLD